MPQALEEDELFPHYFPPYFLRPLPVEEEADNSDEFKDDLDVSDKYNLSRLFGWFPEYFQNLTGISIWARILIII